jgi:cytochrome c556
MRNVMIAATLAIAATAAVAAPLARNRALAVMHQRHEGMESIGKTNKVVNRELAGSSPNLTVVHAGAAQIASLSRKASGWFPAGTGPDVGKTGAKPLIWQDPKDFAAKLAAFQRTAQAFNLASASSDLGAIHARFTEMGHACKACHDKYRTEMKH